MSAKLENWFTYHDMRNNEQAQVQMANIRIAALELARVIENNSPPSPDQTTAIRKVREAMMTANAAIACGGQ